MQLTPRRRQYLTFCGFCCQLCVWLLAACSDAAALASARPAWLAAAADNAACAVLPLATAVTALFYALFLMNPGHVIDPRFPHRPAWLSPVMHGWNSGFAVFDILLAHGERRFTVSARTAASALFVAYTVWIQIVFQVAGEYPYPVLNKLPHPWGWAGTAAVGRGVAVAVFAGGGRLAARLRRATGLDGSREAAGKGK